MPQLCDPPITDAPSSKVPKLATPLWISALKGLPSPDFVARLMTAPTFSPYSAGTFP